MNTNQEFRMPEFFISLVVPVYNVSEYLDDALSSVFSQLPEDCEVICVDDGSRDDSLAKLHQMVCAHPEIAKRTTIIEKEHVGVSRARNAGIEVAKGRYIGFLDPDDWLSVDYFSTLRTTVEKNPDASIVCFNATWSRSARFTESARSNRIRVHPGEGIVRPQHDDDRSILADCFACGRWFPWARLYERTLFDVEKFTPGMKYQDMMLLPILYLNARSIVNIESTLVFYRVRPKSITSSPGAHTFEDLNKIIERYSALSENASDPNAEFYELVLLAAFESYFHAAKRLYGRMEGSRVFARRQAEYGRIRLLMLLGKHFRNRDPFAATIHLSPWLHMSLNAVRRRVPGFLAA